MCFLHEYRNTKMSSMYKFHIFIVVINVLLQHCATLIDGAQVNYDKFQAWTLVPRTKQQLTFLENLADLEEDGGQIQFWDPPTSIGNPVRLIIGPEKINKIQNHAKRLKLPIDHQITNLKDQLVQEKIPRKHYDYKSHVPDFSLDEYHRYDDIQDYLRGLEKEYANFVQVDSIGLTPDGRSIDAIKIGDFSANSSKPTLWIDAGIHAREWIAPATALYIIDQIVSTYATSNDSDVLQVNWMVLPVVNPDGYEYSHTNDRLWRKNRGKCRTQKKNKRCCYGVDLNRNWNFHWKTSGVSTRPCASNYPGEAAFSEPETKAMSDYILEHKDDIKMLLTLHSYGQYWMYPYGHKKKTYSTNVKMHQEIAATAVGAIRKNSGQRYRTGSAADALYPASGCSDDWAKSIGIDIVYTVELPPRNSFVLSPTKIGPTGDDMWKAILTMVEYIQPDNKYLNDTPTDPELGVRCENYSRKCARYSKSYCDRVSVRKRCPLHCNNVLVMHILWESSDWPGAVVDPAITCLSWLALDDADQGLLGAGSQSGSIGVTRTSITPHTSPPPDHVRLNCNLRGHHAPIALASWNQPQKKLATCDDGGIIYVWMPYEERWSVELVNDRGIKVSDFAWSPSGCFALICYHDDFVLIGSASGQRIWSNVYLTSILCGTWSPDSTKVVLGTGEGHLHYLTDQGVHIAEYTIDEGKAIQKICWFKIDGVDENLLCLCFPAGVIYLMKSCDDPDPIIINTHLNIVSIRSNPEGDAMAVVGTTIRGINSSRLQIYRTDARLLYSDIIPFANGESVSSFTWAHGSQSVILAAGGEICVGRVVNVVPPLQLLCSHKVWKGLGSNATSMTAIESLPIPPRYRSMIALHNYHIIQCRVPREEDLCESVCKPSSWQWYCSIKPVPRLTQVFTLCVEHLGGLVPVLVGRQIHKLLPEFEIRYCHKFGKEFMTNRSRSSTPEVQASAADSSTQANEATVNRDSVWRRSKRQIQSMVHRAQQHAHSSLSSQIKKEDKLAQVCSNMWCTRFKLIGMASKYLPPYLGQVMYKTSVLHLQPRQMTVQVVNLDAPTNSIPVLPPSDSDMTDCADENLLMQQDEGPPIAPFQSEIFLDQDAAGRCRLLMDTEEQLLKMVLGEFNDLRSAVDRHIARMRDFASELQQSSRQLQRQAVPTNMTPACPPGMRLLESVSRMESSPQFTNAASPIAEECEPGCSLADKSESATVSEPILKPGRCAVRRTWTELVDGLEYIDEDESLVVTNEVEKRRLRARALSYSTPPASAQHQPTPPATNPSSSRSATTSPARTKLYSLQTNPWKLGKKNGPRRTQSEQETTHAFRPIISNTNNKELKEISSVLDKLSRLANDLTSRQGVMDGQHQASDKVCPHQQTAVVSADNSQPGPYSRWRATIQEIAGRVNQLERRVNYGNELLDEVRGDLQARVNRIRVVLGDTANNNQPDQACNSKRMQRCDSAEENGGVLTLHNKTPFWNEASQVYQLDFGGRITQESAKNFQIEYQDKQVMQFGRIENGCYTLDFQSPFCAVQAFAVALASITQRLK